MLFNVPDRFHMVLDMEEGTLSFIADGQFLGTHAAAAYVPLFLWALIFTLQCLLFLS